MDDKKYKRILVIGDIHGCNNALQVLLATIQPGPDDLIITLGDYIDRGQDSFGVLETLIPLYERSILLPLRGNHETMLLEICHRAHQDWQESAQGLGNQMQLLAGIDERSLELWISSVTMGPNMAQWLANGGQATIDSYRRASEDGLASLPKRHFRFMEDDCHNWVELNRYICVHGGLLASKPIAEVTTALLHWKRTDPKTEPRHCSGKIVVCGHTIQHDGYPGYGHNAIGLDTGACYGGWLSCLDLLSGECWQANELGKVRKLAEWPLPGKGVGKQHE